MTVVPVIGALLAGARRAPGRLLLTGLAIAVATVFAADALMLGATLESYLRTAGQRTPDAVAVVLTPDEDARSGPDRDRFGADLAERLREVPGVGATAELWTARPLVLGAGVGTTWELRSDPTTGPLDRLRAAPLAGRLASGPGEVVLAEGTAARTGTGPGHLLWLVGTDGTRTEVTVTGVVALPGEDRNTVLADTATAVRLGGELTAVDVAAAPGTDPAALLADVGAAVGDAAVVGTGDERRAGEVATAAESVRSALVGVAVFAGLSVLAAAVVVASALRIVLTRRRTQLALLRCVGAGRGALVTAVLVEAAVCGLVAGALGIGVAVLAGHALLGALRSGAVSGIATDLLSAGADELPDLQVSPPLLAGVLGVAVLATVLAAVGPALAASRVPPVAALGTAAAGETGTAPTERRLVASGSLVGVAAVLVVLAVLAPDPRGAGIGLLAGSGLVLFAALLVAGPVLARAQGRVLGRPVSAVGGAAGRLAVANAADVPRRTAATVSVLTLGVGLAAALLVALVTTRADAEASVEELFPAEMVVLVPDEERLGRLTEQLAGHPWLRSSVDGLRVLVDPAPGVTGDGARRALEQVVADSVGRRAVVEHAAQARAQVEATLGGAWLLGLALVGMTAVVAVVGVGVTLTLSVTERTGETGLLRAVGLSRRGVRAMVAWEAAAAGLGAAVLGALIGVAYGLVGARLLGVGVGFVPASTAPLAGLVVGVTAVAVLAALVPAVRAGRVPPVQALHR